MTIDLSLVIDVAEKVLLLAAGAWFGTLFEQRPRLFVYYGHVGVFQLNPAVGSPPPGLAIHTHTVVIQNTGRRSSHNVRVPHRGLLAGAGINVHVTPGVAYSLNILPGGQEEILFPVLAPKQQVTISYLYQPPLVFSQINLQITSDEGVARALSVLPARQWPPWLRVVRGVLVLVGIGAVLYGLIVLYRWATAAL